MKYTKKKKLKHPLGNAPKGFAKKKKKKLQHPSPDTLVGHRQGEIRQFPVEGRLQSPL